MNTCDIFLDAKAAYEISTQVTTKLRDNIVADLNSQIRSAAEKGYFNLPYSFSSIVTDEVMCQVNMIFTDAGYRIYKKDKFTYAYCWGRED